MVTATMSKKKMIVLPPKPVSDAQHAAVVKTFAKECVEVDFTIRRLPTSRKAKGKVVDALIKQLGGTKTGVKTSWSLFQSKPHKDTPTDDAGILAIKALNNAIGDLEDFRDRRTLVKSGDVGVTDDGEVKVESGKRLIYAEDATSFYDDACVLAERIDGAVDNVLKYMGKIKANDRLHAGELWDEAEYSEATVRRVGVATDAIGDYLISFGPPRDYSVLPKEIAEKAAKWAEGQMTTSIESAMESVTGAFNKALTTFLGELTSRQRIDPVEGHPWKSYCAHGNAEVVKTKIHEQDDRVPHGHVVAYISYRMPPIDPATEKPITNYTPDQLIKVNHWVGPIPIDEYEEKVRPAATEERKKIYPQVIEGLIAQMHALREYKSKMLGAYGDNLSGSMNGLLETLNQMKRLGDDNSAVAKKTADALRKDDDFRQDVADIVADTIEALEENVEQVRVVRRRIFRKPT